MWMVARSELRAEHSQRGYELTTSCTGVSVTSRVEGCMEEREELRGQTAAWSSLSTTQWPENWRLAWEAA